MDIKQAILYIEATITIQKITRASLGTTGQDVLLKSMETMLNYVKNIESQKEMDELKKKIQEIREQ